MSTVQSSIMIPAQPHVDPVELRARDRDAVEHRAADAVDGDAVVAADDRDVPDRDAVRARRRCRRGRPRPAAPTSTSRRVITSGPWCTPAVRWTTGGSPRVGGRARAGEHDADRDRATPLPAGRARRRPRRSRAGAAGSRRGRAAERAASRRRRARSPARAARARRGAHERRSALRARARRAGAPPSPAGRRAARS